MAAVYSLSNDVVRGHVIIIDTVIIDSQFIYNIKKKLVKVKYPSKIIEIEK